MMLGHAMLVFTLLTAGCFGATATTAPAGAPNASGRIYGGSLPEVQAAIPQAVGKLGWKITSQSETHFTAQTKMSAMSWGDTVQVSLAKVDEGVQVDVTSTSSQAASKGHQQRNIDALYQQLDGLLAAASTDPETDPPASDVDDPSDADETPVTPTPLIRSQTHPSRRRLSSGVVGFF